MFPLLFLGQSKLDDSKKSMETMLELQRKVFKVSVVGASLTANNETLLSDKTTEAKEVIQQVEQMSGVAKKAMKVWNAWLTLQK